MGLGGKPGELGPVIACPAGRQPLGVVFEIEVVDGRQLRKLGGHAQGQRSLERDERVGAPPTEQRAQGPPEPQLQQPWPTPRDGHAPNLHVGAQLKHLVVGLVHHKQELVMRPQTHQFLEALQGEDPNALELSRDQQPTVQGNARHAFKGTFSAH